jgi:hypothetical protein
LKVSVVEFSYLQNNQLPALPSHSDYLSFPMEYSPAEGASHHSAPSILLMANEAGRRTLLQAATGQQIGPVLPSAGITIAGARHWSASPFEPKFVAFPPFRPPGEHFASSKASRIR